MGYDLFLKRRDGAYDRTQFLEYFSKRDWYKVQENQAWYENEDTGVYFSFDLDEPSEGAASHFPIALRVNFCRPSYVIAEVETEVTILVNRFDMIAFDPQSDVEDEEYQKELLIAGWHKSNEWAISTYLRDPGNRSAVWSIPSARLTEIWTWNRQRRSRQAHYGASKFVPRIGFIKRDRDVLSAVIWPDGAPSLLPPVEYLIIMRQARSSTPFGEPVDEILLSWQDAQRVLERHGLRQPEGGVLLEYDHPPADVAFFLRSLPAADNEISMIGADRVLDREIVDKHMR
jgi:hypothetical protein